MKNLILFALILVAGCAKVSHGPAVQADFTGGGVVPPGGSAVNSTVAFGYNGTVGIKTGYQLVAGMYKLTGVKPSAALSGIVSQNVAQMATTNDAGEMTDNISYVVLQTAANIVAACVPTTTCNGMLTGVNLTKFASFTPTVNGQVIQQVWQAVFARNPTMGELQAAGDLYTSFSPASSKQALTNYLVALLSAALSAPGFTILN